MNRLVLQYSRLENLLAEAGDAEPLRVHLLEQSRTTTSETLAYREATLGVCVRAILPDRVLAWYGCLAHFGDYLPVTGNGRSACRTRREAAWTEARQVQDALAARLRDAGHAVLTDGVVELGVASLLPGTTGLINVECIMLENATEAI